MKKYIVLLCVIALSLGGMVNAKCPPADFSGDCEVNIKDYAILASEWMTTYNDVDLANMASEWLTQGYPEDPRQMVWVSIDDDGSGMKDVNGEPITIGGFTGEMSKYKTTHAQYCQYLNAALASGDVRIQNGDVFGNSGSYSGQVYYDMSDSDAQISYSGSSFYVESRGGHSMANHPVIEVSWYGATAFANYYAYRLPTEWEWQAVADYDGTFTYGCGKTIHSSIANFGRNNPLGLSSYPYTSPVNHYTSFGYGMNDMTGNSREFTSSCYYEDCEYGAPVVCGGSWGDSDYNCTVFRRSGCYPDDTSNLISFRVCR